MTKNKWSVRYQVLDHAPTSDGTMYMEGTPGNLVLGVSAHGESCSITVQNRQDIVELHQALGTYLALDASWNGVETP